MKTTTQSDFTPSRRRTSLDGQVIWLTHLLTVLRSEYRRAVAAEWRYQELRRTNLTIANHRATSTDVPRRLFAEMYSRSSHEH